MIPVPGKDKLTISHINKATMNAEEIFKKHNIGPCVMGDITAKKRILSSITEALNVNADKVNILTAQLDKQYTKEESLRHHIAQLQAEVERLKQELDEPYWNRPE